MKSDPYYEVEWGEQGVWASTFHTSLQHTLENPHNQEPLNHLRASLYNKEHPIFLIGVGKSFRLAELIASFLKSLSWSAWALHPTDMQHGDKGVIKEQSVLIFLSRSGESEELLQIAPHCLNQISFAFIERPDSRLAQFVSYVIQVSAIQENPFIPLMPYRHTLLVMGLFGVVIDNLLQGGTTSLETYSLNHPGGRIGMQLSHFRKI